MSDDLKMVKQLQQEIGIKLPRVSLEKLMTYPITGFAADDNGWVRGLAIWGKEMLRPPALLSTFQRLEKLLLFNNKISDISSLKELKGLTHLELGEKGTGGIPAGRRSARL
ncbi:MAG: leucine-rich repeat domain-containing protein [Candidatus Aminicenantes bacterium]|nr:MAG: leucine-rich repeat domain-containing protein [Candidatus Aminicenantes bacterium]